MTIAEIISRFDYKLRPIISKLPPAIVTKIYSSARKTFINRLSNEIPKNRYIPSPENNKLLWGIKFSSNIFNAAGMFKYGEGYYTSVAQGAGAYLAGTSTFLPRKGNEKEGVLHPFIAYPNSLASSNWMGLPNESHEVLAKGLSLIEKIDGCPVGASIAASPDETGLDGLVGVLKGIEIFDKAGVDFIELNESCPNVPHDINYDSVTGLDKNLIARLEFINNNFIKKKKRNLPLIVKLSVDTNINLLPSLLNILFTLEFDGVNFGNTSTDYETMKEKISHFDSKNYEYFVSTFGGGLSGRPLKDRSLTLASFAVNYAREHPVSTEFHVIRTGGIENSNDIKISDEKGISLNQWFTGYFENFAKYGHHLYERLYQES
ncbi:MAG: hypothetical protein ABSG15_08560 [FCB group bacterium]